MKTVLGVLATIALSSPALAVTLSSVGAIGGNDPGFGPFAIPVVTFDSAMYPGITETDSGPTGSVGLYTGTIVDFSAAPWGDTTKYQTVQPGGAATFDFTKTSLKVGALSFYMGSIDTYNMFSVTTNKGVTAYLGTDFPYNDGGAFSANTNRRVFLSFGPGEIFRAIKFSSSGIALEYDTLAVTKRFTDDTGFVAIPALRFSAAVPEPATWTIMLAGLAAVGAAMRRRGAASTR